MADVIKTATREAYGKALVELGEKDESLIVMDADLAAATKTGMFKKAFPDRFLTQVLQSVTLSALPQVLPQRDTPFLQAPLQCSLQDVPLSRSEIR